MTRTFREEDFLREFVQMSERIQSLERVVQTREPIFDKRFPDNPFNGQQEDMIVEASQAVRWRFAYRDTNIDGSANSNTQKWEFVGGPPLVSDTTGFVATSDPTNWSSTTNTLTVPLTGLYRLEMTCGMQWSLVSAGYAGEFGVRNTNANTNTGLLGASAVSVVQSTGGAKWEYVISGYRVSLAAGTVLYPSIRRSSTGGTVALGDPKISLTPVALA